MPDLQVLGLNGSDFFLYIERHRPGICAWLSEKGTSTAYSLTGRSQLAGSRPVFMSTNQGSPSTSLAPKPSIRSTFQSRISSTTSITSRSVLLRSLDSLTEPDSSIFQSGLCVPSGPCARPCSPSAYASSPSGPGPGPGRRAPPSKACGSVTAAYRWPRPSSRFRPTWSFSSS